jgi:hypothetical protein
VWKKIKPNLLDAAVFFLLMLWAALEVINAIEKGGF